MRSNAQRSPRGMRRRQPFNPPRQTEASVIKWVLILATEANHRVKAGLNLEKFELEPSLGAAAEKRRRNARWKAYNVYYEGERIGEYDVDEKTFYSCTGEPAKYGGADAYEVLLRAIQEEQHG